GAPASRPRWRPCSSRVRAAAGSSRVATQRWGLTPLLRVRRCCRWHGAGGRCLRAARSPGFSGFERCGGRGRCGCWAATRSSRPRTSSACAWSSASRACARRSTGPARPATRTPPRWRTRATSSSARAMPADSPLAERVAGFIAEHRMLEPGEPVLALVSGGADSLCVWGLLRELGYEVEALHAEHGLRGEAGLADAAFCAGLGATVVPLDLDPGPNLEASARAARYAAAEEHAAGRAIATGHTLTDQAETVVYRLASSSGVRALSAKRPRSGRLVRPLLCATADETRDWCRAAGLVPRVDDTNADTRLRRNLIRRDVMPALRLVHPAADVNIARTAELLGELDELLSALAGEHLADELDLDRLGELPRPLQAIVLRAAAERAAGRPLRLTRALTDKLVELAGRSEGIERLSLGRDLEAARDRRTLSFGAPAGSRYPPRP